MNPMLYALCFMLLLGAGFKHPRAHGPPAFHPKQVCGEAETDARVAGARQSRDASLGGDDNNEGARASQKKI